MLGLSLEPTSVYARGMERTLGLIGGMSWQSTLQYYRWLNEGVAERRGGLHSARCILHSVDFADVAVMQAEERWDAAGELLARASAGLARAGADAIMLCTNTMHLVAEAVEAGASVPFLHIADATADALHRDGHQQIALLGTSYTMEQAFYRGRLESAHGLDVRVPDESAREAIHRIIYDELCRGVIRDSSRDTFLHAITALGREGATAVVLGCTEIGLLVGPDDAPLPAYDTARLHAEAGIAWLLDDSPNLIRTEPRAELTGDPNNPDDPVNGTEADR